jgi:hypothetical protein
MFSHAMARYTLHTVQYKTTSDYQNTVKTINMTLPNHIVFGTRTFATHSEASAHDATFENHSQNGRASLNLNSHRLYVFGINATRAHMPIMHYPSLVLQSKEILSSTHSICKHRRHAQDYLHSTTMQTLHPQQIYKAKKARTAPTIAPAGLRLALMEDAAPVNSGSAVVIAPVPVPEANGRVAVIKPDGTG